MGKSFCTCTVEISCNFVLCYFIKESLIVYVLFDKSNCTNQYNCIRDNKTNVVIYFPPALGSPSITAWFSHVQISILRDVITILIIIGANQYLAVLISMIRPKELRSLRAYLQHSRLCDGKTILLAGYIRESVKLKWNCYKVLRRYLPRNLANETFSAAALRATFSGV